MSSPRPVIKYFWVDVCVWVWAWLGVSVGDSVAPDLRGGELRMVYLVFDVVCVHVFFGKARVVSND